jgi:1-deoxy-D-xylulose-5-phosphate synthase
VHEVRERLSKEGIRAAHYDLRFVKPLDSDLLSEVFTTFDHVITVEDGVRDGGAGSAVVEWMTDHGFGARVVRLGHPDRFIEHGTQRELHDLIGIGPDGIFQTAMQLVGKDVSEPVTG